MGRLNKGSLKESTLISRASGYFILHDRGMLMVRLNTETESEWFS